MPLLARNSYCPARWRQRSMLGKYAVKMTLAIFAFAVLIGGALAADWDYPPSPAFTYPPPPPAYVYRPPGSPPSVVFYAPNPTPPSRCLPGFFWRVYADGNGECWPSIMPGVVFNTPSTGRCSPGFFWRVYPDGNAECWPWD
jgi:hypothetical protein